MQSKLTVNAMIPARIGSTRFKMKNLAMLNGKPMIAYAIMAALSSKMFDRVIVNSDDEIFRSIAAEFGAEFYLRPPYLGGSQIRSDNVVEDFLQKHPSDIIVWENPIAPLQTVEDIQRAVNYFIDHQLDSLFTVKNEQVQCVYMGSPVNFDLKGKFELTQNLSPVSPFVPFIMMWRATSFLASMKDNGHAFFTGKVGYFPVSKLSSIVIKYEEDFRIAEMLMRGMKENSKGVEYYKVPPAVKISEEYEKS